MSDSHQPEPDADQLLTADGTDGAGDQVRGVPSDNTTLTSVMEGLAEMGYDGQFSVLDLARLRCTQCDTVSAVDEFSIDLHRRLEGASDPDDMMTVLGAACPACGARGTVVLGYGPNASPEDAAVSSAVAGVLQTPPR